MGESENKKLKQMYNIISKRLNKLKLKSKILIIAGSTHRVVQNSSRHQNCYNSRSYAMTAITVTSQNTSGVKSIIPIAPREILNQIIFTSKDIKPDAIKIGMLHSKRL